MTDSRYPTGARPAVPTVADVAAYAELVAIVREHGPEVTAVAALGAGQGCYPCLLFLAAQGEDVDGAMDTLCLVSGDVAEIVDYVHRPDPDPMALPDPIPDDQKTVFPDDDAWPEPPETPYERRRRLHWNLPRGAGARLAAEVPGLRGLVMFMAARGDHPADVARILHLTQAQVDALLTEADGMAPNWTTFPPDDP